MTSFFIPRGLRVRETDSNPSVIASELVFPNATLSVAGSAVTVQGLVAGPSSATDNAVARFDATTGKLLQNSDVIITDDGFVGIGTASPDRKLVIDGSTGSPGLSVRHTARSGGGLDISSGNNRSSIFNSDALPLRLGVESTTAINISSTNEVTFPVGVALGTPLSGVATNLTGTASGLTAGTVTTNANLTGHVTSVGNAAVLGSFTKSQLDTAVSDGNVLYVGDVTSNATHTGDVTGDTALTIANSAVTLAKMANLAQDQFVGRTTASTGVPETATITAAARTVLDDATVGDMVNTLGGATSTGTGGLVRATSPALIGTLNAAAITASGTISSTANGAASTPASTLVGTWFTGGDATTTKPQLLIEPTGTLSTGWSTSGTGIGVNAASGFTGNLIDVQVSGAGRFRVNSSGTIFTSGSAFVDIAGAGGVNAGTVWANGNVFGDLVGNRLNGGIQFGNTGVMTVRDIAYTDAVIQVNFGNLSSPLYPAWRREASSTTLAARLSDNSADCPVSCSNLTASGTLRVGGGTVVANILSATATLDFGSIGSNDTETLTITVTGAVAGDSVFLGCPAGLDADLIFCASVTAADTVTVRMHNSTGGAVDPASATFRATVIRF
jgi:hypothetical protein